jgi:hypothetical protein
MFCIKSTHFFKINKVIIYNINHNAIQMMICFFLYIRIYIIFSHLHKILFCIKIKYKFK